MRNYAHLGAKIRKYRVRVRRNMAMVADALGVNRTYLSKLENGHERPAELFLNKLVNYLGLSKEEAVELSVLAGYKGNFVVIDQKERKEVTKVNNNNNPTGQITPQTQVNMPPDKLVFYSDAAYVTTSQWGVVFDFAQTVGPTNQQNVVARVGMSKEHARALLDVLKKRLESQESEGKN